MSAEDGRAGRACCRSVSAAGPAQVRTDRTRPISESHSKISQWKQGFAEHSWRLGESCEARLRADVPSICTLEGKQRMRMAGTARPCQKSNQVEHL